MKTSTLKAETFNHLTIVAKQINKMGAFEHFTKMSTSNLNPISMQETLISKYNINPAALDYLYRGSDEQCVESSLLIAIRCDELRVEAEKAKSMINWAELSRTLAGDRSAITKDRIPQKHAEIINELIDSIVDWLQKTQTGL